QEELQSLQPLPRHRFIDYAELTVRVTTSSTIEVKRGLYSVPSRLIGETMRIHLYHDKIIGFIGQTTVITLPREYPDTPLGRTRLIDYRHVIHSLAAKPQAFRYSNIRNELLPDDNYRQLWELIDQQLPAKDACKWIVTVLRIAAKHQHATELGQTLLQQALSGTPPTLKKLQETYLPPQSPPEIITQQHSIAGYDELLSGHWKSSGEQQRWCPCH
ncbi:MAG: IS21 family transposase, partial [Desulfuromonadales bacterium]|nr:IS21 family transposase [Desulfuromonadales bacterium]